MVSSPRRLVEVLPCRHIQISAHLGIDTECSVSMKSLHGHVRGILMRNLRVGTPRRNCKSRAIAVRECVFILSSQQQHIALYGLKRNIMIFVKKTQINQQREPKSSSEGLNADLFLLNPTVLFSPLYSNSHNKLTNMPRRVSSDHSSLSFRMICFNLLQHKCRGKRKVKGTDKC